MQLVPAALRLSSSSSGVLPYARMKGWHYFSRERERERENWMLLVWQLSPGDLAHWVAGKLSSLPLNSATFVRLCELCFGKHLFATFWTSRTVVEFSGPGWVLTPHPFSISLRSVDSPEHICRFHLASKKTIKQQQTNSQKSKYCPWLCKETSWLCPLLWSSESQRGISCSLEFQPGGREGGGWWRWCWKGPLSSSCRLLEPFDPRNASRHRPENLHPVTPVLFTFMLIKSLDRFVLWVFQSWGWRAVKSFLEFYFNVQLYRSEWRQIKLAVTWSFKGKYIYWYTLIYSVLHKMCSLHFCKEKWRFQGRVSNALHDRRRPVKSHANGQQW